MIGPSGSDATGTRFYERRPIQSVALVLMAIAIPIARVGGSFPTARFFHSDIAFLPALFEDLTNGGSITDWGLPEAPYFVPDWPLYFVAWLTGPNYQWALTIFAFFQILLMIAIWQSITKQISPQAFLSTAIGSGVIIAVALFNFIPIDYISVSFAHFGTVLLTLGAVSLYLRLGDSGNWILPALGALTVAASASDRLYVVWAVAPLVALELLPAVQRQIPIVRRWALTNHSAIRRNVLGTLISTGAIGVVLGRLAVRSSGNYKANLINSTSFVERFKIAEFMFRHEELSFRFSGVTVLLILVWFISVVVLRSNRLNTLFFLWFVTAVSAAVIVEFLIADFAWRYHQFLYQVPLLAVGLWLPPLLVALTRSAIPAIAVVALLVTGTVVKAISDSSEATEQYSAAEVECLDSVLTASGSREGIGNYAAARLAVVMSDLELEVGSRNSFLGPEDDVHSRAWARDSADFALIYPTVFGIIPEASLLALGEPIADEQCGAWRILDFGPGGLDLDRLATAGQSAEVLGCWIPEKKIGVVGEGCTLALDSQAQDPDPEPVILKAFFPAEPGLYKVTIQTAQGSAQPQGSMEIGVFDQYSGDYLGFEIFPLALLGGVYEIVPSESGRSLGVKVLNTSPEPFVISSIMFERIG